ncbi:hypothetical protein [Pandoraea iniqua]|uniref:hypothetical protein n=1 Tax=Pandoraea iniqua TaxID=2508288 RepID=UPI001240B9D8|nr:hypothetical protein [Pandoraea iniqua]
MNQNVIHELQFCDGRLLCKDLPVAGYGETFAKPFDHPGVRRFGIGVRKCVPRATVVSPAGDTRPEKSALLARHSSKERENADVGRPTLVTQRGHSGPAIHLHQSNQSVAGTILRAASSMRRSATGAEVSERRGGMIAALYFCTARATHNKRHLSVGFVGDNELVTKCKKPVDSHANNCF